MLRSFNGKTPRVAPTAFVSEQAYVVGDVEIADNASVWPGAVVRSDDAPIRIGTSVNVQDGSILHASGSAMVIGDGVSIGHGVVMHGRGVGAGSLLGNNCTVLDGATVGRDCLIAANAVVLADSSVPDGSFVTGIPGRIKGPVTNQQREMIRRNAPFLVAAAKQYKEQGL